MLSRYSSQSLWCVLSLSLITSLSVLWYSEYPYTESHHSLHIGSENPYTHHSLPRGTQTIPLLSQSAWWYSDYPYTHHSLPIGTQTITILITVSLVILRLFLYFLQPPWRYFGYPYTHHSLPGGTQNIPINITVSLMVLRLSLKISQHP